MESNNISLKISKIGTISISEFLLSITQKIIYLNSMIDFYGQSQTFSQLNKIQIFDPTTISEKKKNSMGPTIFCFQITDGSKKWTIRRRLSDLLNLEKTVKF